MPISANSAWRRAVVEQGDLHGPPGGERTAQQVGHRRVGLRFLGTAAPPDGRFPGQPFGHGIAHPALERHLRIAARATRRRERHGGQQPDNADRLSKGGKGGAQLLAKHVAAREKGDHL